MASSLASPLTVSPDGAMGLGQRLAADEPGALDECYRALGPLIRSYLARFVAPADVDDVAQRVFWELWSSRARYDPKQSLNGWALGIARKRAIDHHRRRSHVVVPIELIQGLVGEDGRETANRSAAAAEVRDALAQLPAEQRLPLQLMYFAGHTQLQVAALLHVPLGTVKSRTSRGLKNLARLIEADDL